MCIRDRTGDVFEQKAFRAVMLEDSGYVVKQSPLSCMLKSLASAYGAEGLAGKSGGQDVEFGNLICVDFSDVTVWALSEVGFIRRLGMLVPLAREDTRGASLLERKSDSADTCEEVDKARRCHRGGVYVRQLTLGSERVEFLR